MLHNPVYTEPVLNYTEGLYSRVSIEVYTDTIPGDAQLYLLGVLDPNKVDIDIPVDFVDAYNVRFTRSIFIDSTIPNTQQIFFYKQPTIIVDESVKAYITQQPPITKTVTGSLGSNSQPDPSVANRTYTEDELKRDSIPDRLRMLANRNVKLNLEMFLTQAKSVVITQRINP